MEMTDSELMFLAFEEAGKSAEPLPCGVVITNDGKVIAQSHNMQRLTHDSTGHAEILAIRNAGKELKNKNLDGCNIYSSCEPCTMCLSAIIFSKIEKLHFGISLLEVSYKTHNIDIDLEFL